MDKMDTISSLTHGVTLSERKNIIITGVKKIDSLIYKENNKKNKENGVFNKLFK